MKLIIDLDSNLDSIERIKYSKTDIILTIKETNELKCRTIKIDFALCDLNDELSASINDLFNNHLPLEFRVFRNTFFAKVFRPVCSLIIQIEELLKNELITKMILIGGGAVPFITLFGGEGEGRKHFYKSSWLFNGILFTYFKDELAVNWYKKKSQTITLCKHFFRENLFFYSKLINGIMKSMKYRNGVKEIANPRHQNNILAFAILPLQLNHINNITEKIEGFNKHFIIPYNSILTKNNKKNFFIYGITVNQIIKASLRFKKLSSSITSDDLIFVFKNSQILLKKSIFLRSLKLSFILFESKLSSLDTLLNSNFDLRNTYLVSNMTYGADIVLVNELSKRLSLPHYNFQAVTMSRMIFPQMKLASRYFLYSKTTFNFYNRYISSFEYYLPIQHKNIEDNILEKDFITLSIFMQPDSYTEKYLNFLKSFLPVINNVSKKTKIIIKPHYRQDRINDLKEIVNLYTNTEIIEKGELAEQIIKQSDLVLSMTSSILFESVILGHVGVIINTDRGDNKLIYEDDVCLFQVNFIIKSPKELMDIINNYDYFKKLYTKRRDNWLLKGEFTAVNQLFRS